MAIFVALTATSLLVVRQSVKAEVRRQITEATESSVADFGRIQGQQTRELERSATLLSEIPILKSLMTAPDRATIQDASAEFRELSDTDLLLLARPNGDVVAVHAGTPGLGYESAERLLQSLLQHRQDKGLWQEGKDVYLVVTRPIIAGSGAEINPLGYLTIGKRIDNSVAKELGSFAGSEVLLVAGKDVIAATRPFNAEQLQTIFKYQGQSAGVELGDRHYAIAAVNLPASSATPILCYLLLPLTSWDAFLNRLNQNIVLLGGVAILGAIVLVLLISRAITEPLESLVSAVRALAEGNYQYAVQPSGSAEVAELGAAFNTMRQDLLESQRKRLESERLAALGRAAGSISHDLRHQLAAVVANAEFLYNVDELKFDREEIYGEVRRGSAQMTELIDSLMEISREKPNLVLVPTDLGSIARKSAESVLAFPDFRERTIQVQACTDCTGVFDPRKLERVFINLLLNACEATPQHGGRVTVEIEGAEEYLQCRIADNGSGIPDSIRVSLFEPFVSAGKNNGTGLGLAIAKKIVEEHGGEIGLSDTSSQGSVFVVRLPRRMQSGQSYSAVVTRATLT